MKVVILAGGFGSRLSEETETRPKPMVEIGDRPILWHIMKHYAHYGFKEFLIALGYKGSVIKRYFMDYYRVEGNLTANLVDGSVEVENDEKDDWIVHLIDTGLHTSTGGRIKRLRNWLADDTFMVTYGDGVGDIDLASLLAAHRAQGRLATVTAVRPPARFGGLSFEGDLVSEFIEKPQIGEGWINGGFLVLEPGVFDYLPEDSTSFESDCLAGLSRDRQLAAYRHCGFWQCMDTLRDRRNLDALWENNEAAWKVWDK